MARKISVEIVGDASSLSKAFSKASGSASSFGSKFGAAMKTVGKIALAGGAAITTGLALSAKSAIDFESSFAGIRKTVKATEPEFKKLERGMLDLSRTIPVNVNELNRIGEAAGQLGIKKQNILSFTETIAKLGVTTNLSSEEAATSLARFANITKLPQKEIGRLGSTIVALGNNLATTESEIVEFGLRIAGAGKQVGLTEPQILALGGALSSVGIGAEAGGTAISTVMITMAKAVQGGGAKLAGFAQVAGKTASEFAAQWKRDPSAALLGFIEGLDRTKKEGGNVFAVLDKLGLGGIRVRDALLRAAGAGDLFRRAVKLGTEAWQENVALNKEAEQRFKTTAAQWQLFKNNINAVAVIVGSVLIPVMQDALLAVSKFTRENWDTIQSVASAVGGAVVTAFTVIAAAVEAAAKKVLSWRDEAVSAFETVTGAVKAVVGAFTENSTQATILTAALGAATAAVVAFTVVTKIVEVATKAWAAGQAILNAILMANPIVLVAAALVALAAAVAVAYARSETFRDIVNGVWADVRTKVTAAVNTIRDLWERFGDDVLRIGKAAFQPMATVVKTTLENVMGVIRLVAALIRGDWSEAWDQLKGIVTRTLSGVVSVLKTTATNILTVAKTVGKAILDGVVAGIGLLADKVREKLTAARDAVVQAAEWAYGNALAVGKAIVSGIAGGLASLASTLAEKFTGPIVSAYNGIRDFLGIGSPSKLMAALGADTIAGYILGITSKAPELKGKTADAIREALEAARSEVEKYQGKFTAAFDKLGDAARRAFDAKTQSLLDKVDARFDAKIAKWQGFADALTPAEKALAKLDQEEAARQRASALSDAQAQLAAAEAMEAGVERERAIAQAKEAIRQAELANRRASLEAQAEVERAKREEMAATAIAKLEETKEKVRTNLEEQRRILVEKLDAQLAALRDRLAKHPEEWNKIQKKIKKLLEDYGADYRTAGENLGKAFAKGIDDAADAVARSAKNLAGIVAKYLKTSSPTEKGPMASLDRWWDPFASTLVSGLDTRLIQRSLAAAASPGRLGAVPLRPAVAGVVGPGGGGAGGRVINVTINGWVGNDQQIARRVLEEIRRVEARNA